MGNVNRVPWGLLAITDSQTQGVSPDEIQRTISAQFDILPLWLSSIQVNVVEQLDVLTLRQAGTPIVVTQGEIWQVECISALGNVVDNTTAVSACIEIDYSRGGGFFQPVAFNNDGALATTAGASLFARGMTFVPPQLMYLPGGCQIRIEQIQASLAGVNGTAWTLRAAIRRLRV
jgi:hypothetical protein